MNDQNPNITNKTIFSHIETKTRPGGSDIDVEQDCS